MYSNSEAYQEHDDNNKQVRGDIYESLDHKLSIIPVKRYLYSNIDVQAYTQDIDFLSLKKKQLC